MRTSCENPRRRGAAEAASNADGPNTLPTAGLRINTRAKTGGAGEISTEAGGISGSGFSSGGGTDELQAASDRANEYLLSVLFLATSRGARHMARKKMYA